MVLTTGLPLVMVRGKFGILNQMSIDDLEQFLPFLTKCSLKLPNTQLKNNRPPWWYPRIPFHFPLKRPNGQSVENYRRNLIYTAFNCYLYYKMDYIVNFCSQIARNPRSVYIIENEDYTTSLFSKKNDAHILTFNNVNKYYERSNHESVVFLKNIINGLSKKPQSPPKSRTISFVYLCDHCDCEFSNHAEFAQHERICPPKSKKDFRPSRKPPNSPRRHLLPPPVQETRTIQDVYLCENCDEEFSSQVEINAHEVQCYGKAMRLGGERSKEVREDPKDLLGYLRLVAYDKVASPVRKPRVTSAPDLELCLLKNRSVEFSSQLGQCLLKQQSKRDIAQKTEKLVSNYEAFCYPPMQNTRKLRDPFNFRVLYKPCGNDYFRTYCFNTSDRQERLRVLKTGLDKRSRKLLGMCKSVRVMLDRLAVDDDFLAPKSSGACQAIELVDLCDSDEDI